MKPAIAKAIYQECIEKGYVEHNNVLYPPAQAAALNIKAKPKKKSYSKSHKTGWTDDSRNIKNKAIKTDQFIKLVELYLKLDVWPEFYFMVTRQWRFDYCIPEHKIFIEVEGGVYTNGRHTRPKGFMGDMEKYNSATALGWKMIRTTPSELLTTSLINIIKKTIFLS